MRRYRLILGTLTVLACSGQAIDVGPAQGAGNGSSTGDQGQGGNSGTLPASDCVDTTPLPTWPKPDDCVDGSDLPLVGTWQGYMENEAAPWDQLKLVIAGASIAGGVCGTLTVGTGPAPAPATDPNVGYYPAGEPASYGGLPGVLPGYPMTLLKGTTDGARVRFTVAKVEPYRGWCQLQSGYQSTPNFGSSCSCIPPFTMLQGTPSDPSKCTLFNATYPKGLPLDCGKAFQCEPGQSLCICNATGCDAWPTAADTDIDFDLRFTAASAEGSNTIFMRAN
ncbi:MAG TPA: hypothetical protein VNW92_28580 [Polyangiaceae bacterium]|jgi:hypothetical protein|nr:hypothetical protein [Polyangiaceae bacterium]